LTVEHFLYLACLIFIIGCLLVIDWHYRLAFWLDKKRTAKTLSICVFVFILWDLLGIGLNIFKQGSSQYQLPLSIVPEFPIEELFFLFLLCYFTLLIYLGGHKIWTRI